MVHESWSPWKVNQFITPEPLNWGRLKFSEELQYGLRKEVGKGINEEVVFTILDQEEVLYGVPGLF